MAIGRLEREPVAAAAHDRDALMEIARLLRGAQGAPVKLVGAEGGSVALPDSVVRLLGQLVQALAREQAVAVVPIGRELTTQQAADLLNISRPYLIQLLDRGEIPHRKTGTHRRIALPDLLAYKERRDSRRTQALDDLVRLSQELGLYDVDGAGEERACP